MFQGKTLYYSCVSLNVFIVLDRFFGGLGVGGRFGLGSVSWYLQTESKNSLLLSLKLVSLCDYMEYKCPYYHTNCQRSKRFCSRYKFSTRLPMLICKIK